MTISLNRFACFGGRMAVLLAAFAALAFPAAAAAQTAQDAYSSPAGTIQADVKSAAKDPRPNVTQTTLSDSGGALPFTGLDLAFLLMSGSGLLLVGAGLRHATRHEGHRRH
jgi:hypothetical protein